MKQLRKLESSFGDSVESAMRRFFSPSLFDTETPPLHMRIDVDEDSDAYTVKADLPGVKKEDINIRVDGNVVRIDAEMKGEKSTTGHGGKTVHSERYWGDISRTFSVAQDIDEGKTEASYRDGVLTVKLPKKAGTQPNRITVQ
ncbi:MAG: Hsp20/alpha crystallin family protein [Pseudomonadota bacterium]